MQSTSFNYYLQHFSHFPSTFLRNAKGERQDTSTSEREELRQKVSKLFNSKYSKWSFFLFFFLSFISNFTLLVDSHVVGLFRETAFFKSWPCNNVFNPIYDMSYLVDCFNLAIHPLLRHLQKKKPIKMLYLRASKTMKLKTALIVMY